MKPDNGVSQILPVKVGVYFRCGNGLVPQHFLYSPEVGSALDQMCGKGVPEGMGTHFLINSCDFQKLLNNDEHHNPAQPAAPAVQEENILVTFSGLKTEALGFQV